MLSIPQILAAMVTSAALQAQVAAPPAVESITLFGRVAVSGPSPEWLTFFIVDTRGQTHRVEGEPARADRRGQFMAMLLDAARHAIVPKSRRRLTTRRRRCHG
jgi:hypothetical protein